MIRAEDISVVVQGPIDETLTPKCLKSVRKYYPEAELIVSTWSGSDVSKLDFDFVVFNKDPGFFYYSSKKTKINNINRQIKSTLSGLKKATRPYVLKIRTDFILTGNSFLHFFRQFPQTDEQYRIFKNKIINLCYFARNPREEKIVYLFHPSDIALFGLTQDVLNVYDVPFMPKEEEFYWEYKDEKFNRYLPEQYIFVNCLLKNGHKIDFRHQRDDRKKNLELTERYFASNFVFINFKQFNLLPPNKMIDFSLNDYRSCITHGDWKRLYKYYVDDSVQVCSVDKDREEIELIYKFPMFFKLISQFVVLPMAGKKNKELRKRMRAKIKRFLGATLSAVCNRIP